MFVKGAIQIGFDLTLSVENPAHSDFLKLRNMLVRTHMQDLKDMTRETHYENYRAQCIQNMTRMVVRERKRRSEDKPTSSDDLCTLQSK